MLNLFNIKNFGGYGVYIAAAYASCFAIIMINVCVIKYQNTKIKKILNKKILNKK